MVLGSIGEGVVEDEDVVELVVLGVVVLDEVTPPRLGVQLAGKVVDKGDGLLGYALQYGSNNTGQGSGRSYMLQPSKIS
jgi:hypothetical protein